MPRLLYVSVFPAGPLHTEDGGRGGKVAPGFGEWLPAGHRRGDPAVASRTCFPSGVPLPLAWEPFTLLGGCQRVMDQGPPPLRQAPRACAEPPFAHPRPHPGLAFQFPNPASLPVVGPQPTLCLSTWLWMQASCQLVPVL